MIGSALLLPACAPKSIPNAVRIGSTDSDENATIAQIYASTLERAGIPVDRRMRLGDEQTVEAAISRGDIDLYPGLLFANVPTGESTTLLAAAPAAESPCLVTSQYSAEQFWLLRLTKCAALAPQLRLAASPDFLAPGGPLDQLKRVYGGFNFKAVTRCDPGTQYYVLNRGDADVANGDTTDSNIAQTQLIVLSDDKHFWRARHLTPVIRVAALRAHPQMRTVLDRMSRNLTLYALQQLNSKRVVLDMDPRDVAEAFVQRHAR